MKSTKLTWKEILVRQAWTVMVEVSKMPVMNFDGNSVVYLLKVERPGPEQI